MKTALHIAMVDRPARLTAALALLGLLAGCGSAKDMLGMNYDHLPEDQRVEQSPWPRLADAPPPTAPLQLLEPDKELPERKLGAEISADVKAEADALRGLAAEMRAEPVIRENLRREAAQVRARNAALDAQDQRAAKALASEEAASRALADDEAARIRAEIEAELKAARGEAAAAE